MELSASLYLLLGILKLIFINNNNNNNKNGCIPF